MEEHEVDQLLVELYNTAYACGHCNAKGEHAKSSQSFAKHMELKEVLKQTTLQSGIEADAKRICGCAGWPLESDYCEYCGGYKSTT